uniref:Peroxidase n=1 Tax=Wollemia nobilis TaxID=56998 RepID=A0A0C9RWS7_9CONI
MAKHLLESLLIIGIGLGWNLSEGLQVGFYSSTCPDAESVVRSTVENSVRDDQTIAAALLRLHFHDCFIQGCDGSILIDGPNTEQTAPANAGLRGLDVIENAKRQLEAFCPGVVSCADIVALAARDSILLSNGPEYELPTGRRDGFVSSASDASNMPDPTDSIPLLQRKFAAKGLSTQDLVLLNAAHTIGTTACFFVTDRLYNFGGRGSADPTISPEYLTELRGICPKDGDVNVRLALDRGSELTFDKDFLQNVRDGNGVLESDAKMYEDSSTRAYIDSYFGLLGGILGPSFESDFANAMIKMGQIGVKTRSNGKIRRVCSVL